MWVGAPASPYSVLQVKIQGDKRRLHGQTSIIAERQRVQECYSVKTRFELWITEVIELEQRQTNGKSRETCNQQKGTRDISIILKFLKDRNLVHQKRDKHVQLFRIHPPSVIFNLTAT